MENSLVCRGERIRDECGRLDRLVNNQQLYEGDSAPGKVTGKMCRSPYQNQGHMAVTFFEGFMSFRSSEISRHIFAVKELLVMTTILIPLYEGVTHLDFTGPHELLTSVPGTEVIVASMGGLPIDSHGLTFSNLADLNTVEHCDVLCVPGGLGCVEAIENDAFLCAIRRLAGTADYVTSVCTGSLILGAGGLLEGRRATTHWAWRDMLADFGAIPEDGRVVRDGNIITGGGVTAGIDFALTIIAELRGADDLDVSGYHSGNGFGASPYSGGPWTGAGALRSPRNGGVSPASRWPITVFSVGSISSGI